MATFRKRGDMIRVEVFKNGVRKSKTFRTKAEAQYWAADEERKIEEFEKTGVVSSTLFSDVIRRYQAEVSPKIKNRFAAVN